MIENGTSAVRVSCPGTGPNEALDEEPGGVVWPSPGSNCTVRVSAPLAWNGASTGAVPSADPMLRPAADATGVHRASAAPRRSGLGKVPALAAEVARACTVKVAIRLAAATAACWPVGTGGSV